MLFIKSLFLNINYKLLVGVFCIFFLAQSCKEREIYSNIPQIEYKTAYLLQNAEKDSLLKLVFTFKDGDGDIGLTNADTVFPFNPKFDSISGISLNKYYFNCYVSYKEKIEGTFYNYIPVGTTDTFEYNFRIQNLTPEGRHKAIRGDIELDINISPSQRISLFNTDTVIYGVYIFDRQLNKSNIIETPPIIWRR
jgi:hypothetical protein